MARSERFGRGLSGPGSHRNRTFLELLIKEQMRRASQLSVDLNKNLAAGRIRTDQQGLSTYLRVLNQTMEQLDVLFGSSQAQSLGLEALPRNSPAPRTVLIVDDVDMLREMVRGFLESLGIRVLEASSAAKAIRVARSHADSLDLLLTDVEMPRISGWELAEKIAVLKPGIRILYMSAGISLQEWTDSKQKVAHSYFIQKPFRLEELRDLMWVIFSK